MTSGRTLVIAICLAAVAAGHAEAEIRNAYFSKGKKLEGHQIYRTEGDLPGPAKVLEAGQDRAVYLWVIFGDLDPHVLRGDLKGADGKVVRTMRQRVGSVTRPGIRWRSVTHEFSLDGLAPGEYSLDLIVDDTSTGTHSFTLK